VSTGTKKFHHIEAKFIKQGAVSGTILAYFKAIKADPLRCEVKTATGLDSNGNTQIQKLNLQGDKNTIYFMLHLENIS